MERFTVGDLREALSGFSDDVPLLFNPDRKFDGIYVERGDDPYDDRPQEVIIMFDDAK